MNFNGHHGCLKCTTVGEYNYISSTTVFPRTDCPARTDADFRARAYGRHHKEDSPLLQLNIDMIKQFPVGDSLHLLHQGLMKRLLLGWKGKIHIIYVIYFTCYSNIHFLYIDNTFRNADTKWPSKTTIRISEKLLVCRLPREIHRKVRGLDVIKHWKATEFRTFLLYTGIVVLKDHLSFEVYQHFLLAFCAVTICETKHFARLLPLAKTMLEHFVEMFREIYGEAYMTSNIHNLVHLVDEVMQFGDLQSICAYPFESMLGTLKTFIRNGNNPLSQAAKPISEMTQLAGADLINEESKHNSVLTKSNNGRNVNHTFLFDKCGDGFFSKIQFNDFFLATDASNSWFLSKNKEIVCVKNILSRENTITLYCHTASKKKKIFSRLRYYLVV